MPNPHLRCATPVQDREIGTDKKCPEQKRRAEEDEQLFPSASGLLVTFVDKEVDEEVEEEVDDEEPFSSTPSPLLLFSGARTKVSPGATRPGGITMAMMIAADDDDDDIKLISDGGPW